MLRATHTNADFQLWNFSDHHVDMTSTAATVSSGRQVKHKTLSAYYTHIYRLKDCFDFDIALPTDSTEYLDLISTTLCAVKDVAGLVPLSDESEAWRSLPRSQRRTQQEWVDWVLGELSKRGRPDQLLKKERASREFAAPSPFAYQVDLRTTLQL
jgi:hypothetical protein